ncbi:hypothetical protein TNCV_3991721 [Trichonephila clavipes]|uniref:Uncharacterized protein n=1 Tax=Trichonephila clavipes TaxID=2585209 RepID=A0A8X6VSH0_TRICX|nr:hypothetical protein TNCV_3991721 [Trichonephila clavipes]
MVFGLKRFQASWRAIFSSVTELGGCKRATICRPSISHTCSIVFNSGEFAGHDMRWMFSVSRKSVISQHRSVTWRIIIHEYEVRTDSTSKQANIRLKNFVSVSLSSHRPRVKEMEVCAAVHHDACP